MKLGIIREGKVPPDKRVPLTPKQCAIIKEQYPNVEVVVQKSEVRKIKDSEYAVAGISVVDDVSDCDILMGVKEVNKEDLIPNKTYLFFSHTFKKQPYNRDLLRTVLDKKIRLIDYEVLTNKRENRIIGFGRYAGIVGTYNGFLAFGKKHGLYDLKAANLCEDRVEMESELDKVKLPSNAKIVLTGFGRVGHGAREIMGRLKMKEVSAEAFLNQDFEEPVYTQLEVDDYFAKENGEPFDKYAFYESGDGHVSSFDRYLKVADMYIACHYWSSSSPYIYTRNDLKMPDLKTSVVADISCDIDGPVASTIRPSTIAEPLYGYNPHTEQEDDYTKEGVICVMAVDNLPCELPKDASEDFGNELIKNVLPHLFGEDTDGVIARASQTNLQGHLAPRYQYLQAYVNGEE
ncbi:MAG: NAD(P)-dependent oxidoreductase [Crocinitomicaceae bacterium]